MKSWKLIALLLAMVMCFSLFSACGSTADNQPAEVEEAETEPAAVEEAPEEAEEAQPEESAAEPVEGISDETLVVATDGEPTALVSVQAVSAINATVTNCMYDTLFRWNSEEGVVEPCLATGYEWIDSTHLRVTLREDVYFSNGEPFTADDVMFTWEQGYNGRASSAYVGMGDPTNFIVEDDHTIQFVFANPYGSFTNAVCTAYFHIANRDAFVECGEDLQEYTKNPVGTGKYVLSEWVPGEYIVLERNENYWNQDDLPYYKYIRFNIITDGASRALAIESGDVQVALGYLDNNTSYVEEFESYGLNAKVHNMPWGKCILFGYANNEALLDARVREAIYLAIDPSIFLNVTNSGYGAIQDSLFAASSSVYCTPTGMAERVQNLDRAIELMKESGYYENLTLDCIYNAANPTDYELMQSMLGQIGITVNMEALDASTFLSEKNKGTYDILINAIDNADPIRVLNQVDSRCTPQQATGGSLYLGDNQEELYELIDACKASMTAEEQAASYQALVDFLYENYVLVGLCNQVRVDPTAGNLSSMTYDIRGWPVVADVRPVA